VKSEHVVQLFDTPESLGESVGAFLRDGLARDEVLLVVARGIHLQAIASVLAQQRIPIHRLLETGRLTMIDAVSVLRQLLVNGMPDDERFERVVGGLVRGLAADGTRVRVYGEMVDILAEQMEFGAVIALEQLWNTLSASVPITLLCGYGSAHFVLGNATGFLRKVCSCHHRVVQGQSDMLGSWVLAQHIAAS
jgi:hypothetical protein